MLSSMWRARSQWPPSPSVEEESDSLAHELDGLSLLSEQPGIEGVCSRGTIDQDPILQMNVPPSRPTSAESNISQDSTLRRKSSKSSFIPKSQFNCAHPPAQDYRQNGGPIQQSHRSQRYQYSGYFDDPVPQKQRQTRTSELRADGQSSTTSRDRMDGSSSPARPDSNIRSTRSASRMENPPTANGRTIHDPAKSSQPSQQDPDLRRSAKRPTVAELIEEKLRRRKEQQGSRLGDAQRVHDTTPTYPPYSSKNEAPELTREIPKNNSHGSRRLSLNTATPASAPQSSVSSPRWDANPSMDSILAPTPERPIASLVPATPRSALNTTFSNSTAPLSRTPDPAPLHRSQNTWPPPRASSCSGGPPVVRTNRGRAVSFADKPGHPISLTPTTKADLPSPRLQLPSSPTKGQNSRSHDDLSSLCLRPCPRPVPVAGYHDWYTITGLSHLDICPSCMNQLGQSRFRDFFVPSLAKPREQKVRCSFSEPWTRLAWLQSIKKKYNNLDMLYEITRPQPAGKACPGRASSIQSWYRVVDPETGNLPRFNACSACIRNLRILMPTLRDTFRPGLVQERICDLSVDSPRFVQYLDLLDAAANHCEYENLPRPDIRDLVAYIQRKSELRDCRRDKLILSTWHYIPHLPEFTICEDCYDDVVWPLAAAHMSVARMVSRTLRLPPGSGPSRCREASCQLYSPRMRTRFREAVQKNDFAYLKSVALKRLEAERLFREKKQVLLDDENRGYDRDAELRHHIQEWKKVE